MALSLIAQYLEESHLPSHGAGQVIKGWDIVKGMKIGEKRRLVFLILGYGARS